MRDVTGRFSTVYRNAVRCHARACDDVARFARSGPARQAGPTVKRFLVMRGELENQSRCHENGGPKSHDVAEVVRLQLRQVPTRRKSEVLRLHYATNWVSFSAWRNSRGRSKRDAAESCQAIPLAFAIYSYIVPSGSPEAGSPWMSTRKHPDRLKAAP